MEPGGSLLSAAMLQAKYAGANKEANVAVKASFIVSALRRHLPPERWAFFPELIIRDGMQREERRLDVWAISLWPSDGYCRACYEIKVSRGDWLKELKQPAKRRLGVILSNEYWLATPPGLVRPEELPPEAGLMEVDKAGRCTVARQAPWRETLPPTWALVATVARRAQREEQIPMREIAELATEQAVRRAVSVLMRQSEGRLQEMATRPEWRDIESHRRHHAMLRAIEEELVGEATQAGIRWIRQESSFSR